jgi:hypothetical protein
MDASRRAVAGVLLGLATSIGAVVAVLLIAWGHCGGSGEDCDVELAVASLAAVPVLLLVAVVLLLLSARESTRFLKNSLVVLALFVGLLPLGLLSGQEWWSLLLFGAVLSALVGYVVVPQPEAFHKDTSRRSESHAAPRATPSRSASEALEEMQFWAEQVKSKTADFRRGVHALRQR